LLGPVTRFTTVGESVEYEIAQVRLNVLRKSSFISDITVYSTNTGEELRSYLTESGLLFSTISNEAPPFKEFFPDLEPLLARVDFTKLPHRRSIAYEGAFNWKTMVDGYQECLHCQYTHPSFSIYYPPAFYSVYNHTNFSQHIADPKKPDDGLFLYFFPNCTLNVYGGGMSSFRVCPTADPGVTRMEFDYYHIESGEKFEDYYKFVRQVAIEDFELCEKAQANLEKGIYSEGILNPIKETGVACKPGSPHRLPQCGIRTDKTCSLSAGGAQACGCSTRGRKIHSDNRRDRSPGYDRSAATRGTSRSLNRYFGYHCSYHEYNCWHVIGSDE
jgi:hypothetical protein